MIKKLWLCFRILSWYNKTFKGVTSLDQQKKVVSEIYEFLKEKENYSKANYQRKHIYAKRMDIEMIDVFISALNLLHFEQFYSLAKEKLDVNKKREWEGLHHKED